jgi:hypothetical protein
VHPTDVGLSRAHKKEEHRICNENGSTTLRLASSVDFIMLMVVYAQTILYVMFR